MLLDEVCCLCLKNVGGGYIYNGIISLGNESRTNAFDKAAFLQPVRALYIGTPIDDNTALVFQGLINIEAEGLYKFSTLSDDGSRLYIDGKLIVDNDGDHGVQEKQGSVNLTKGKYQIKVEYFNAGGGCFLNCLISGPGIPKQIISPDFLTTDSSITK